MMRCVVQGTIGIISFTMMFQKIHLTIPYLCVLNQRLCGKYMLNLSKTSQFKFHPYYHQIIVL